jgi:hypothetical protein
MNNIVRYGLGSASYDNSGTKAQVLEKQKGQYLSEINLGKQYPNILLLRSAEEPNELKFNLLLHKLPVFLYGLHSMNRSGLEQTAFVGNRDAERIHKAYCSYFGIKNCEFIYEGEPHEWSRANTARKGYAFLNPGPQDLVAQQALDTIFFDTTELIYDPDAPTSDVLLKLNAKNVSGDFCPRNFHLGLRDYTGNVELVKEGNGELLNIHKITSNHPLGLDFLNVLYEARKFYGGKKGGQVRAAVEVALMEKGDSFSVLGFPYKRLIQLLSNIELADTKEFTQYTLGKYVHPSLGVGRPPAIKASTVEKIIEFASRDPNFKTRVKISQDPGAIDDTDSLQDIIRQAAKFAEASYIYPYSDELGSFARKMNGEWGNSFTNNTHKYLNALCSHWNIDAKFGRGGVLINQSVFPQERINLEIECLQKYQIEKAIKDPVHSPLRAAGLKN